MSFLRTALVAALCLAMGVDQTAAHARHKCPKARDWNDPTGKHIPFDNTGNKYGPCGPYSGKFGMGGVLSLTPNAWQTFTFEEAIGHPGAPFRLAVLDENEVEQFVLLDHIPHNELAMPIPYIESTYVPYNITAFIPDVKCDKCVIQLIQFMTDKTVKCGVQTCTYHPEDSACSGHTDNSPSCFGAPNNTPCKNPNTCFSNYHSCVDVTIDGKIPLNKINVTQPEDWPFRNLPDLEYSDEVGNWSNALLQGAPSQYTTFLGQNLC